MNKVSRAKPVCEESVQGDEPTLIIPRFLILLAVFSLATGQFVSADILFPPAEGPYSGDYVYITEPGRYTLEQNISHSYPVGVIIAAPSVILDGQGCQISPSGSGSEPHIGVWITPRDTAGRLVTGVSIRNLSVSGETYGIYAEGDTPDFSFGTAPARDSIGGEDRTLALMQVDASRNRNGIVIKDVDQVGIESVFCRDNTLNGMELTGSAGDISRSVSSGNTANGILVKDVTGITIRESRVEGNGASGIFLERAKDVLIANNILDNPVNLVSSEGSDIRLNDELRPGTSITGSLMKGGNLWAMEGASVYGADMTDADNDGIGDLPYDSGTGWVDQYPLLPASFVSPSSGIPVTSSEPVPDQPASGSSPVLVPLTDSPGPAESPAPSGTPLSPISDDPVSAPVVAPIPVRTPVSVISGSHAVIIGDTIPSDMKGGETQTVTITLYNDGTEEWLPMHNVGISALDTTASWGEASYVVPLKSPLCSKESYTFTFEIHAPKNPGIYELRYQAGRGFGSGGVEATFGRPYSRTVTIR